MWAENRLTAEGRHLHDRAHRSETESRGNLRIVRGLRLRSLRLGLSGIADVVEFHLMERPPGESIPERFGVHLPKVPGVWRPRPVEYKRGKPKAGSYDEVQLCAQALCLEEMLGIAVPSGDFFYGQPRQRYEVEFTPSLREQTKRLAARLHTLTRSGKTPFATYEKKCDSCSLFSICLPKTIGRKLSVAEYLHEVLDPVEGDTGR